MSPPPKATLLSREDFASQADWIDRLLRPLNSFMQSVSGLFGGNSLEALGDLRFHEVTFTTGDPVTDAFPQRFQHGLRRKPRMVMAAQIEDVTAGGIFVSGAFPTWDAASTGEVRIRHLAGLDANTKYRVVWLVLA